MKSRTKKLRYRSKKKNTQRVYRGKMKRKMKRKLKKTKQRRDKTVASVPVFRQRGGMQCASRQCTRRRARSSRGPPRLGSFIRPGEEATGDILSEMKSMVDSGELDQIEISEEWGCRHSQTSIFKIIDKYHNPRGGRVLVSLEIPGDHTWSSTAELVKSGGHYIVEASIFPYHSFYIEIKDLKFRILSLWERHYGFLEFPNISKWGNFDGHEDYDVFLDKLRLINGGSGVDLDTSGIEYNSGVEYNYNDKMTPDEERISKETVDEIFKCGVDSLGGDYGEYNVNKGLLNQPRFVLHLE